MQKAIFIDRDGVINVEKNYLYKIEDFEFIEGVFEALKSFQTLGYKLFIITNQSGIARGYYTLDDFNRLTEWMLQQFEKKEITISDVQLCPHGPHDECNCRKPKTGMIDAILKKHAIDLTQSWLIGDKTSDIECAQNAGIAHTIQVKSGHEFETSLAEYVCDSIKEAKDIIRI
ncbi:D-glycero-beta-D-manno-heptose 1,7-bisphosphate 7-phosphatase [Candidatus Marinarcus aquaticus]|nr:D-glycero-beta-D-manno-heptose 1,7-bisphosphate 7-phosphatase [Candidatus Marinarcus aquaticus]